MQFANYNIFRAELQTPLSWELNNAITNCNIFRAELQTPLSWAKH